jgi:hypothetical protein
VSQADHFTDTGTDSFSATNLERFSDAALSARIRADIKFLNANLAEAARRRLNVHISDKLRTPANVFYPQAVLQQAQAPAYINENSQLDIAYIQRTVTEKF